MMLHQRGVFGLLLCHAGSITVGGSLEGRLVGHCRGGGGQGEGRPALAAWARRAEGQQRAHAMRAGRSACRGGNARARCAAGQSVRSCRVGWAANTSMMMSK